MKIGTITQEQIIKADRKARREADLINTNGWVATHKVHKSKNNYTRKNKHKNRY